ncbi:MAG: hypothetical protein FWF52_03845 [Candidatus Azobacteroides sp.]|nr:hypothetical protein [Candidatus Azobacteroides sp.]
MDKKVKRKMANPQIKCTFIFILLGAFLWISCREINTTNPQKAFKYWTGAIPPADFEFFEGQYWQSAHITKEYILYLKFKPTKIWWNKFLELNNILEDKNEWIIPTDAPDWFRPSDNVVRYRINNDFDQGSRYFIDTLTGICSVYEIQL